MRFIGRYQDPGNSRDIAVHTLYICSKGEITSAERFRDTDWFRDHIGRFAFCVRTRLVFLQSFFFFKKKKVYILNRISGNRELRFRTVGEFSKTFPIGAAGSDLGPDEHLELGASWGLHALRIYKPIDLNRLLTKCSDLYLGLGNLVRSP